MSSGHQVDAPLIIVMEKCFATLQKADVKGAALPILRDYELYGPRPVGIKGSAARSKGGILDL